MTRVTQIRKTLNIKKKRKEILSYTREIDRCWNRDVRFAAPIDFDHRGNGDK